MGNTFWEPLASAIVAVYVGMTTLWALTAGQTPIQVTLNVGLLIVVLVLSYCLGYSRKKECKHTYEKCIVVTQDGLSSKFVAVQEFKCTKCNNKYRTDVDHYVVT